MAKRCFFAFTAASLALLAGCIVGDQVATLTIRPDGSADYVIFQTNLRSTEPGEAGARELERFVADFDANQDLESRRILEAGGQLVQAQWLRREEPYATVIAGRFPSVSTLLEFLTVKGGSGELAVQPRFTRNDSRRRLSFEVSKPRDMDLGEPASGVQHFRNAQADGLSETRIAVAGGKILASRGFTVAADRRSALLEPNEIRALLRVQEQVELYLEWEVE
jgi:hypothetical protein